jgi:hypothetical protein
LVLGDWRRAKVLRETPHRAIARKAFARDSATPHPSFRRARKSLWRKALFGAPPGVLDECADRCPSPSQAPEQVPRALARGVCSRLNNQGVFCDQPDST